MCGSVLLAATLYLISVHGPGGQGIEINVREISSIRQVREVADMHFSKDIRCIVIMTNGKFIGVMEDCQEVVRRIMKLDETDPEKGPP
jgi:hypothetical protein